MKKLSLMIAALALVLGLSQCKKDEKPVASGEKQHIVLNASFGDSNSKIAEDGIGGLKWAEGDVINVFKGEQSLSEDGLTCTDPENGTFEGEIATTTGNITFTFGSQNFDNQSGSLNDAISLTSGEVEYKADGIYDDVTMTMPHAVLKLDLSAFADDTKGEGVTVTITSGEVTLASVTGITANSKAVYVALPADGTGSKKYTFNNGKGMNAEMTWPLAANTFYTNSGSATGEAIVMPAYPVGALSGLFSVSDNKQVYFSKGNLQYNMNTTAGADKWRFAPNQYECIGSANKANVQDTTATTDTWIDLFGWGTSGYHQSTDTYNTNYQPWSTSKTAASSGTDAYTYNRYGYGPSTNVTPGGPAGMTQSQGNISGSYYDWGVNNAISNGGNQAGKWRTLTGGENGEWNYLLNQRTMKKVSFRYTNKSGGTTIDGETYKGLFIYPDDYSGKEVGGTGGPSTWDDINNAGIVFLPAAGFRDGTSVYNVGLLGDYWSSSYSSSSSSNAYGLGFFSGSVSPSSGSPRYYGLSVRLVSEN